MTLNVVSFQLFKLTVKFLVHGIKKRSESDCLWRDGAILQRNFPNSATLVPREIFLPRLAVAVGGGGGGIFAPVILLLAESIMAVASTPIQ